MKKEVEHVRQVDERPWMAVDTKYSSELHLVEEGSMFEMSVEPVNGASAVLTISVRPVGDTAGQTDTMNFIVSTAELADISRIVRALADRMAAVEKREYECIELGVGATGAK